jgi:hypothetical protein
VTNTTLLLRQVHPSWLIDKNVSRQTFRPTPKDNNKLSVSDGNMITAEESWKKFTATGYASAGVLAVSRSECTQYYLTVLPDPLENQPEHTLIDFSNKPTRKSQQDTAKILKDFAITRGWQFMAK